MDDKELERLIENIENIVPALTTDSTDEEKQNVLSQINTALQYAPQNADILTWKAFYYEAVGDYDNAIQIFEEVLKIKPDDEIIRNSIKHLHEYKNMVNEYNVTNNNGNSSDIYNSPSLLERLPLPLLITAKIIILAVVLYYCCPAMIFSFNDMRLLRIQNNIEYQTLRVNPLSEYDYLSKKQIYDMRKNYVMKSLFASESYEPSDLIFGQIQDNKPWWGSATCGQLDYKGDYHERIEGPSKVSAQMNNPDALVGLSLPFLPWSYEYNREFCTENYGKFLPVLIQYNKENSLIVVNYKLTRKFLKFRASVNGKNTRYPIQMSGLNARDFGYDYMYVFKSKNINMFSSDNNAESDVKTFTDYIHLGGSCKFKDGCNNISPMQYDKMFTVTRLPAEINLKLWKKKPLNKYIKADMYYRIIFDENI